MVARRQQLLDQHGRPMRLDLAQEQQLSRIRSAHMATYERMKAGGIHARYDASQDGNPALDMVWRNADVFSPHFANNYSIRRKLRMRSRYEIMENNPYLRQTHLTIKALLQADSQRQRPEVADQGQTDWSRSTPGD